MNAPLRMVLIVALLTAVGCQPEGSPSSVSDNELASSDLLATELALPSDRGTKKPATLKEQMRVNCHIVQAAAEAFASENDGEYPRDIDSDTTPGGKTLLDFLPGGTYLVNPVTHARTEPSSWRAANPGEIGYVPIWKALEAVGYGISGYGWKDICYYLQYCYGQPCG
jgi:hypothetical protein